MNPDRVDAIANAVLYEGYMLYPYRRSALKNRQGWNFGVLHPDAHCRRHGGSDVSWMQTEVLVEGSLDTELGVKVRCLHSLQTVSTATESGPRREWQEAVEREIALSPAPLGTLCRDPVRKAFELPAGEQVEPRPAREQAGAPPIVRRCEAVLGELHVSARPQADNLFVVTARVSNETPFPEAERASRTESLQRSLLSAHTILWLTGGVFVSLLEPPAHLAPLTAGCKNLNTWPVLAGDEGRRDVMLSSPIILYDYPQVAPESAGSFFDSTEIDEMLALRVMTMTDDEKREMRESDPRAREILERTEQLPERDLLRLHGTLRAMRAGARRTSDGNPS